jgi:hypothetical protein
MNDIIHIIFLTQEKTGAAFVKVAPVETKQY